MSPAATAAEKMPVLITLPLALFGLEWKSLGPICDRLAIGSSGDVGYIGGSWRPPLPVEPTLERRRRCQRAPLCGHFTSLAEGEGFEPSIRLIDV